ncbi:hypothetical protein IIZ72_00120 [Candidatus Saccharibacteria bacterium]|nr:hypothetical protein [Candidatus Saccharibacteria bacterium]
MEDLNVFTVTPMSQMIELKPGETYKGSITVVNPDGAKGDFSYKTEISAYGVVGEGYDADLVTSTEHTQITKWITIENPTGTVKPNDSTKINFTIKVPETAPAGGQYAAILVSSAENSASGEGLAVKNVFEMASLIYAGIAGETERKGEIIKNTVPGFVTSMPIEIGAELKNEGNVHEIAKVALEVKSVFSPATIYPTEGESGIIEEVIMPDTTRSMGRNIEGISPLGIYDVTQTITYMGEVSTNHRIVIACPIWFLVIFILTVSAIIFSIVKSVKKYRHKKEVF